MKKLIQLRNRKGGFTLIELLVVVLILAILMAVALPLYLNSVQNAENRTCRSNMQTIGNAIHANRVATRAANYPASGAVTLAMGPDMLALPVCPNGGSYSIVTPGAGGTAVFDIKCSVAAHNGASGNGFQYGVDNQ